MDGWQVLIRRRIALVVSACGSQLFVDQGRIFACNLAHPGLSLVDLHGTTVSSDR